MTLEAKIKEALSKTYQYALGVEVKWKEEKEWEREQREIDKRNWKKKLADERATLDKIS